MKIYSKLRIVGLMVILLFVLLVSVGANGIDSNDSNQIDSNHTVFKEYQKNKEINDKIRSILSFSNILWYTSAIIFIFAFVNTCGIYVLAFFMLLPSLVVESIFHLLLLYFIISPHPSFINTIVWAVITIFYQSTTMSFFTTVSFMSWIGFSFVASPLCYAIGLNDKASTVRGLAVGFLTMCLGTFSRLEILNLDSNILQQVKIFEPGFIFMGSLVYSIALLITSSRYYYSQPMGFIGPTVATNNYIIQYIQMQFVSALSLGSMMYVGMIYNIPALQNIGGTIAFLWLAEKQIEWTWESLGMGISLMILSGLGGVASYWMANNAHLFFQGSFSDMLH